MNDTEKRIIDACIKGATITEAANIYGVSASTVDRLLRQHRNDGGQVTLKRGRPVKNRAAFVTHTVRRKPLEPDAGVDAVYADLSKLPFPYNDHLDDTSFRRRLDVFVRSNVFLDENEAIRPRSHVGLDLCSPYFPHRYSAISKGQFSAVEAWSDAHMLRKAISFQLRRGDPVEPRNVLRAIMFMHKTPSIFRPGVARFIYENFCRRGGRAWDPCAGFGGRLLGAHVAGVHYIGTDVDEATVRGNRELAERLGARSDVVATPAEHFDVPKVDLVFTSPPYFDRERYTADEKQSWKQYKGFDQWVEGFLRRVTDRARDALRPGGHLVLNVADLRERGAIIPLVQRTIDTAALSGFVHVRTLKMPLAAISKSDPSEPVLIFRPA